MAGQKEIEELVRRLAAGTGLFVVAVKVSSSNRIIVLVDKNEGITIDECATLHHQLEMNLDRDVEDFELQVSSPGLDAPFLVIEQYYKNEGKKVEVVDNEGNKFSGILKNVTPGGFELLTENKVKGKQKEMRDISFNFDEIKSTRTVITIK
jgi:ribosome maturation factor RimP